MNWSRRFLPKLTLITVSPSNYKARKNVQKDLPKSFGLRETEIPCRTFLFCLSNSWGQPNKKMDLSLKRN